MPLISTYYDGPVTESDRAQNPAGRIEYGVYGNEDFRVTAHPSIPYAVLVKKGRAHGHGVTDEAEIDQVVNCPSLASGVRWDLIVVRRNWQPELGGPSTLEVIEVGTNPLIPDPPTRKVGPGVEDDQPIALVKWQGGTSAPMEIRDLRVWSNNAGMFAVDPLARQYLNKIGTKVKIAGEVWSYERLSATEADWVNEDGSGPWVELTLEPGWANNGASRARARLVGRGAFVHVAADVRFAPNGTWSAIYEGWIIAKLPGGMIPKEHTFVPGTTNGYRSGTFYTVYGGGIAVGPFPQGSICQLNGLAALK